MYRHIKTMSDFQFPGPMETWVYVDEHPDSINDPGFFNPQAPSSWTDTPATYHHGAANFAFADGHAEVHPWHGSLTNRLATSVRFMYWSPPVKSADPDIKWINYRGGRLSEKAF